MDYYSSSSTLLSKTNPITIINTKNKIKIHCSQTISPKQQSLQQQPPPPSVFSSAKTFLANLITPPLPPSVDPAKVFTGNFAPVTEHSPTECPVLTGKLPVSLNGVYIRNGPNPQHIPTKSTDPLHFFEGDGMVHSISISNGHALYSASFVKTYKFEKEKKLRGAVFPNMLSGFYGVNGVVKFFESVLRVVFGQIDLRKGFGLANTSVACVGSKVLALGESDLPYEIELRPNGDVVTLGRWGFDENLFANMTAHPKFDFESKETFAFKCSPVFPYLTLFRFDEFGKRKKIVPIVSMKQPSFIHDFAITNIYAIFVETQLVICAQNVFLGKGMPVVYSPEKVPRIGIIPRYAEKDDMRWIEIKGFNALHLINAWEDEENEEVVIIAPNASTTIQNMLHNIEQVNFTMEKVLINLKTGEVTRKVLSGRNLELGSINPRFTGKRNRYVYLGIGDKIPRMSGVVKIDVEKECEVGVRVYEDGWFGGEPLFVETGDGDGGEDDGFVVSFVHNERSGESRFVVMDAGSDCLDVVAAVRVPGRVPYGFHGMFVRRNS